MIYFLMNKKMADIAFEYYGIDNPKRVGGFYFGGGNCFYIKDDGGADELIGLLKNNPPNRNDLYINVECNSSIMEEKAYILNALRGEGPHKSFYPEMLFRHPFEEAAGNADEWLAADAFFEHSNIYCFTVSGAEAGDSLIKIFRWLDSRAFYVSNGNDLLTEEEKGLIVKTAESLRLTKTTRAEFYTLTKKYAERNGGLSGLNLIEIKPQTIKREAKTAYDELKRRLLE